MNGAPHDDPGPQSASEIASHVEEPVQAEISSPRRNAIGVLGWARENLFSSLPNALLTVTAMAFLVWTLPPLIDWALLSATWLGDDPEACKLAGGACWSFVNVKHRFVLFGLYPHDEHWRPLLAMALFLGAMAVSCDSRFWNRRILLVWGGILPVCAFLMWGGFLGLTHVPNDKWGGLPLTLILAALGIVLAFPLSVLLALGRRSDMPAIRAVCVGYIETVRGVPLVSVLFMASIMFPLFLPEGMTIDKLLRAQLGIVLFTAAYLAEAVRGGLQALPKGQFEAADALGLSYWQKTRLIILPQALRLVIPPIVNQFISCFKDTSLVIIIGLYDLLTTAKTALSDPSWRAFYVESYVFAALVYFLFCYFMSRYSQFLERRLNTGHERKA